MDFVLDYLPTADRTSQAILLREATILCSTYPVLFNEKVLACVRQKNNLSPASTALSSASSTAATTVTMTNSVVTSFDEETTTTTTPVAIMKPVVAKVNQQSQQRKEENKVTNGKTEKINGITTTTSGGVTIVKLNMAPVPIVQSNQVDSTSIANGINGHERKIK